MTLEFLPMIIAEAKQRSTPILGLGLNSEQVTRSESLTLDNTTGANRSWQGTRRKVRLEAWTVRRSQQCTESGPTYFPIRKR